MSSQAKDAPCFSKIVADVDLHACRAHPFVFSDLAEPGFFAGALELDPDRAAILSREHPIRGISATGPRHLSDEEPLGLCLLHRLSLYRSFEHVSLSRIWG